MLKFCVKESSNLIDLASFGAAGFFITAGLRWCFPYQSESDQISPDLPLSSLLHYFYFKLEIKE